MGLDARELGFQRHMVPVVFETPDVLAGADA
jgi:hypothetical protein